jgi:hypothetical protein
MILNEVIAKLLTICDSATGSTRVYDSWAADLSGDFVVVGSDGEDDDGASVEFAEAEMGPGGWVVEVGEVTVSTWAQSGDGDVAATRDASHALSESCVSAIRANRDLDGLIVGPGICEVTGLRYRALLTDAGGFCRYTFTVRYQHLLTS